MKDFLKRFYYFFNPHHLPSDLDLNLAYVFHTEQIYDSLYYNQLIEFCIRYHALTQKKPICTLMSGVNARVVKGCQIHQLTTAQYADRAKRLAEVSSLGYHGHFWIDSSQTESECSQMKSSLFSLRAFQDQFSADLNWFSENGIARPVYYAAGWWFLNKEVLQALIAAHFSADFSFSQSKYFSNPYSKELMEGNRIRPGEVFRVQMKNQEVICIQNLIGCHQTPFPQDFNRNLMHLLGEERLALGVINSHDYDLHPENTLACIQALIRHSGTKFLDADELLNLAKSKSQRTIFLGDGENQMGVSETKPATL